jgi:hypothetical protein
MNGRAAVPGEPVEDLRLQVIGVSTTPESH